MTSDELMQLKALAEAATPGPWEYDAPENMILNANMQLVAQPRSTVLGIDARNANGAFIANANPAAILSLIAKVESLAADAERYQWLLKSYAFGDGYKDIDSALNDGEADTRLSLAIDAAMAQEKI